MGNPKQKWTTEEEEALLAGVNKYGSGKWKFIQKDPEFNKYLHSRSNIDLKDKWRNMSVAGQGSRPKPKTTQDIPVTPSVNVQTPASAPAPAPAPALAPTPLPLPLPAPAVKLASQADNVKDDVAKELADSKNGPGYNEMIFDALSAEPNGLDIGSVVTYIERRTEVPQNFRKQLGSKLRRLCLKGKLEKVENLYIMKDSSEANKNIRRDNGPRLPLSTAQIKAGESLEEAGKTAAFKVVEAEHKSIAAAEAVKEAERISKLAEETDSIKQLAEEIFERCSHGELVQI